MYVRESERIVKTENNRYYDSVIVFSATGDAGKAFTVPMRESIWQMTIKSSRKVEGSLL